MSRRNFICPKMRKKFLAQIFLHLNFNTLQKWHIDWLKWYVELQTQNEAG